MKYRVQPPFYTKFHLITANTKTSAVAAAQKTLGILHDPKLLLS